MPTLWTQGFWDQEDNWGANHAWRALKAAGHEANNWLVLGPWHHNQVWRARAIAGTRCSGTPTPRTSTTEEIMFPFLDEHLRGGPPANLARVTAYNTRREALGATGGLADDLR